MHDHDHAPAPWSTQLITPSVTPGKRTLTQSIQRMQSAVPAAPPAPAAAPAPAGPAPDPFWFCDSANIESAAARGVETPTSALPHADRIASSFGRHAIDGISAHAGDDAASAARDMGAKAFATGNHVVLGDTSLHTVAHEAAHVIQQRAGVHAKTGDDDHGDRWEQHADQVAAAVVRGDSAEGLLDELVPPGAQQVGGATAAQVSGPVQRMRFDDNGNYVWFGGHDTEDGGTFATWIGQLRTNGDVATLTAIRDNLHREVFTLTRNEAVAKSMVQRELDALEEENNPAVAPAMAGQGQLANLPRDRWWKMFIEGDKHDRPTDYGNAMRFDGENSPGYYAAMMRGFQRNVENTDGHQLDFDDYNAMHVDCTRDILRSARGGGFEAVPHALSARNIQFPMTQGEYPNPRALQELRNEQMLGLDPALQGVWGPAVGGLGGAQQGMIDNFAGLVGDAHEAGVPPSTANQRGHVDLMLGRIYGGQGPINNYSSMLHANNVGGNQTQMVITTNRNENQARGEVNTLFQTYYNQLGLVNPLLPPLAKRRAKLSHVARLVRALHVGHYFHDANGRLNTMMLLDRLLIDAGFTPVIMQRTDIFGGAYSVAELVDAIIVGLQAFADEVDDAHAPPIGAIVLGGMGVGGGDDDSDSSSESV